MTNSEKYKEVFGMNVDNSMCPTSDCNICPCAAIDKEGNIIACTSACTYEWWNREYKGVNKNG